MLFKHNSLITQLYLILRQLFSINLFLYILRFLYLYVFSYLKQLYDYLDENELLCPQQFGLKPNCSTELACATLTDHLLNQMDLMNIPINIYLKLSKAFDTLESRPDHTINKNENL